MHEETSSYLLEGYFRAYWAPFSLRILLISTGHFAVGISSKQKNVIFFSEVSMCWFISSEAQVRTSVCYRFIFAKFLMSHKLDVTYELHVTWVFDVTWVTLAFTSRQSGSYIKMVINLKWDVVRLLVYRVYICLTDASARLVLLFLCFVCPRYKHESDPTNSNFRFNAVTFGSEVQCPPHCSKA